MSIVESSESQESPETQGAKRVVRPYYAHSALFSGFARMRHMWKIAIPVVVVNAAAQATLIIPSPPTGISALFLLTVVISAIVLLASAALIQAASIEGALAHTTWTAVMDRTRTAGVRFSIAIVALAVLVVLGMLASPWLGLVIAAVCCFVTLAAMDGAPNPVTANFRTIAARPLRWAVTMLIIGAIALVLWLLLAVNWFFIPTPIGSFIATTVCGIVTWWWSNSLALIYLSAKADRTVTSDEN